MRKPLLTTEEELQLSAAISYAETQCGGEIAVALVPQSSRYALFEMTISFLVSLVGTAFLILFAHPVEEIITSWGFEPLHLFALAPLLLFSLFYGLTNIPTVERKILPKAEQLKKVTQRARLHFLEAGIAHTPHHRGVLIFISLLERRVELIADRGYNEVISQEQWNSIVMPLRAHCARGAYVAGLLEAIESTQRLIALSFPPSANVEQVLINTPVQLEE